MSILGAITLLVTVLVVALVLDVGRIYVERQRLQGVADAAALAAARVLAAGQADNFAQAAQTAANDNGYGGDLAVEENAITPGHVEHGGGMRRFVPTPSDDGVFTAVRVIAANDVPGSLWVANLLPGNAGLEATAVAEQEAIGTLKIGTFVAGVELLEPVLGGLLGGSADVTLAGYNGLVGSRITLRELKTALGVGTVDELLATSLDIEGLLGAAAAVLTQQEGDRALAVEQLNRLQEAVDPDLPAILLGDLLAVSTESKAALDASLSVFDLVMAAAQLANRGNLVAVDLSSATLLDGFALDAPAGTTADVVHLEMKVIEAPQFITGAPGPDGCYATRDCHTLVRSGQVDVKLHVGLEGLSVLGVSVEAGVDLSVQAARGEAWLETITAANPSTVGANGRPQHRALVGARTSASQVAIGSWDDAGDFSASRLLRVNLPLLGEISASVGARADVGSGTQAQLAFEGPFDGRPENTRRMGTDMGQGLAGALAALRDAEVQMTVPQVGPLLQAALNSALGVLNPVIEHTAGPLVASVSTAVLTPLLQALGIQLGGADVTVVYLSPGQPRLMQ